MEAALEAGDRRLGVERGGEADHRRIDRAAIEQLAIVGEHRDRRRPAPARGAGLGVELGDGDELRGREPGERGQMRALRDPAASEESDARARRGDTSARMLPRRRGLGDGRPA